MKVDPFPAAGITTRVVRPRSARDARLLQLLVVSTNILRGLDPLCIRASVRRVTEGMQATENTVGRVPIPAESEHAPGSSVGACRSSANRWPLRRDMR